MGGKDALSENEKFKITQGLHKNCFTSEISIQIYRDHHTVRKIATNPGDCSARSDKGKLWKEAPISRRALNHIRREIRRNPHQTSKELFESDGVPNVPKSTRCRILRSFGKFGKPEVRPALKDIHKKKRMGWAKEQTKISFEHVLFTDKCRATLDGHDGWRRGWYCKKGPRPHQIRRQQEGGGVMFWAAIIGNVLVVPFKVADGVKMTAKVCIHFLKEHLIPWQKNKKITFRKNMVFVHVNAPSHVARLTNEYLNSVFARNRKIMQCPACSPDLWSTLKRRLYSCDGQYMGKKDLKDAILTASKDISSDEIKNLTSSMDQRVFSLIYNNGGYIKY